MAPGNGWKRYLRLCGEVLDKGIMTVGTEGDVVELFLWNLGRCQNKACLSLRLMYSNCEVRVDTSGFSFLLIISLGRLWASPKVQPLWIYAVPPLGKET